MTSGILMAMISCENMFFAFMDVLMGKFMAVYLCLSTFNITLSRYSRKLLWLEGALSNRNPQVVVDYFLTAIEQAKGMSIVIIMIYNYIDMYDLIYLIMAQRTVM